MNLHARHARTRVARQRRCQILGAAAMSSKISRGSGDKGPQIHFLEARRNPLQALLIDDHPFRARVGEAVRHLLLGPPGVHRHRDPTRCGHGHEGDNPLRVVAHGDRNALALADTGFLHEPGRER